MFIFFSFSRNSTVTVINMQVTQFLSKGTCLFSIGYSLLYKFYEKISFLTVL